MKTIKNEVYNSENNREKDYCITLFEPTDENVKTSFVFMHDNNIKFNLDIEINNSKKNVDIVLVAMDIHSNKIFSSIYNITNTNNEKISIQ